MRFSLLPKWKINCVTMLSPQLLQKMGIKLLMLDFDNTIVPYTTNEPTSEMSEWLKIMVASPVDICVVSNSKRDRVKVFCGQYGIDCITHAKKPSGKGIRENISQGSSTQPPRASQHSLVGIL